MKIQSINVNLGRKVIHEENEHSINIGLEVTLEPEEDSESVYYSLKNTLEGQLDNWEHEIRTNDRPIIVPEISVTAAPPLITASEMNPKSVKHKKETQKEVTQTKKELKQEPEIDPQVNPSAFICPTCGEQMIQKEGKDYFLCTKHWGYPDMIKKGLVKDRKY